MIPEKLGPYRLTRRIGRGGMGTVYEGVHTETKQKAAVKSLAADLGSESDFRQRFGLEIETLRRLNHPNIVRLFGFGEQDSQLFYSMELVEGVSIEAELRNGRRFTWKETIEIGKQICLALRHAHDRGIIHRDLKPANLILTSDHKIKLADFGIARLFGDVRITTAGGVIGTVEYMAPEQASAQPIDHRADLYALGGVLFALLSGRPPLVSRSLPEMLDKLKNERPERVDRIALGIPMELALLIEQLLEKNPKQRVANAMLVERRLEAIEHGVEHELARQKANQQVVVLDDDDEDFEISDPSDPKKTVEQTMEQSAAVAGDASPTGPMTDPAVTLPLDSNATPAKLPSANATGLEQTLPLETDLAKGEKQPVNSTYAKSPMARAQTVPDANHVPPSESGAPATRTISGQAKLDHEEQSGEIHTGQIDSGNSHFTEVAAEELDRGFIEESRSAWVSWQTWILTGCLVAITMIILYLLQPPTADALFSEIEVGAADGSIDSLRDVQNEIREFLELYPNDPRVKTVRGYEQDIEIYRLELRFDKRLRNFQVGKPLTPVERAYVEAQDHFKAEPEIAIQKLQGIIDLYAPKQPGASTADLCVELAKRHIAQLRDDLQETTDEHRNLLDYRLALAAKLEETDPARARAIYQGILTLYGDKPWAKDVVEKAKKGLAMKSSPSGDAK